MKTMLRRIGNFPLDHFRKSHDDFVGDFVAAEETSLGT
jgi:hypothetical protein